MREVKGSAKSFIEDYDKAEHESDQSDSDESQETIAKELTKNIEPPKYLSSREEALKVLPGLKSEAAMFPDRVNNKKLTVWDQLPMQAKQKLDEIYQKYPDLRDK